MPAPATTTSAYVLHNLGLATGFGGSHFGRVALNPLARFIIAKDVLMGATLSLQQRGRARRMQRKQGRVQEESVPTDAGPSGTATPRL